MNIGEYSIEKRVVTLVLTFVGAVGGVIAYDNLGRLEDPEFTIKRALVVTPYPGASAAEVDLEVTSLLDRAIQRMGQIKRLESRSYRGRSIIEVVIKDQYKKDQLPQVWDELRRKVKEAQGDLPPGAGPSSVDDDFGDVYGVYVALTGEGYTYPELKDYADLLRRELLLVQDVRRIAFWGTQPEAVYVEIKRDRMAALGVTQEQIFAKLEARNLAVDGGRVQVGGRFLVMSPSGQFRSEREFEELLISNPGDPLIFLRDVAEVKRDFVDPPAQMLDISYKTIRQNGVLLSGAEVETLDLEGIDLETEGMEITQVRNLPAIGLAISTVEGGNVVTMGEALVRRLAELESLRPVGIESTIIALQSDAVVKAVNGFMVNLAQAIVIVIVVLVFFMGLRAAGLIGFVLFLTITASFIVMNAQGIMLERISLGALIIALGMLVDNAIVVTEGMQIRIEGGMDGRQAAREVVGQNQMPLLGATFVAIIAFAAIGLSDHDTGEYCRSLFQVLFISLLMSWLTAVTVTPLLCVMLFSAKDQAGEPEDPYAGGLFQAYRRILEAAIRIRYLTIPAVFGLFVLSVWGFGQLPPGFFPFSSRPQYMVDLWLPQDTHPRDTQRAAQQLADFAIALENTSALSTHVGGGAPRFLLTYTAEQANSAYAQLLVNVFDFRSIPEDMEAIEAWAEENLPQGLVFAKQFKLGPGSGGNIQVRLSGPDLGVLRDLSVDVADMFESDPLVKYVRVDMKEPVQVVRPVLARAQARRNGIQRTDVAAQLEASFQGKTVGVYREGTLEREDRLLPVISRAPEEERVSIDSIRDLQVYSPAADRMIPMRQVVSGFETVWEDGIIFRRDRRPTLTLHMDQTEGEAAIPFARVRPQVEAWFQEKRDSGELSTEYLLEWGPEYEDSQEAIEALASSIPMFVVIMILIVIALFNNLRQPLVIWLTVPLALIGVVGGLMLFQQPFNFMAILGTLSLSGMLIKNAIVLIDEVNSNLSKDQLLYDAIVNAGVSRLRPVSMAAATTVLGMAPLLTDIFFVSMSIAVMFGLTFATILTLIIVPVLLTTLYRVSADERAAP